MAGQGQEHNGLVRQGCELSGMFEAVLNDAAIGVAFLDRGLHYTYINSFLAEMNGVPAEKTIGKTPREVVPVISEQVETMLRRVIETGETIRNVELIDLAAMGASKRHRMVSYSPLRGPGGEIVGAAAVVRDITERKQAEEALRNSEQMLQRVLDSFPGVVFWKDRQSVYMGCNKAFAGGAGLTDPAQIVGKTDFDLPWAQTEAQAYQAADREVMESGSEKTGIVETQYQADGRVAWFETHKVPLVDAEGKVIGVLGTSHDMTAERLAGMELRNSRQMLQTVLDTIPVGVFWKDRNSVFLGCNKTVAIDGGLESPEEIVGKTDFDMPWKEHAVHYQTDDKAVMEAGKAKLGYEEPLVDIDGTRIVLRTNKIPLRDQQGNIIGTLGSYENITERKRVEEASDRLTKELQRKNAELESILYVASHDLRSALVNVQGFSHELSESYKIVLSRCETLEMDHEAAYALKAGIPESLRFIVTSITKIDTILSGLLRLSRLGREAPKIETVDMNALMVSVEQSLLYKIRSAEAMLYIDKLPPCQGDSGLLNQVFSNLIDNSIKYREASRGLVIQISGKVEGDRSIYCIEDNGMGIQPQYQKKIFETFHRLEPTMTVGEGLGLNIVQRILDLHNGEVHVDSTPGQGSKFFVSLPR